MITGKEMKQGMVDVDKEHIFISFNVAEIREELSEYVWEFDPDNNEGTYLGDPNTVVSNLWIEEAILGVRDDFSYEYDSWSEMRDKIVEDVVYRTKHELKSKTPVSMVTGVLANDQTRGGNNAS
tara:strand:- start:9781 stop:10152 length:372 start_codon:yes stop_codon:yes gene_type:complete